MMQCILWWCSVSSDDVVYPVMMECIEWWCSVSSDDAVYRVMMQCVLWRCSVSSDDVVCPVMMQCIVWRCSVSSDDAVYPVTMQCVQWWCSLWGIFHNGPSYLDSKRLALNCIHANTRIFDSSNSGSIDSEMGHLGKSLDPSISRVTYSWSHQHEIYLK